MGTLRLGDLGTGRLGDWETWGLGDFETGRLGDWVTLIWLIELYNMGNINTHKDLRVYLLSFEAGMEIYHLTKSFPKEETYSLTDQIRRSSRSVSGNLAEAWRKRRYEKAFISKLNECEGEAACPVK